MLVQQLRRRHLGAHLRQHRAQLVLIHAAAAVRVERRELALVRQQLLGAEHGPQPTGAVLWLTGDVLCFTGVVFGPQGFVYATGVL